MELSINKSIHISPQAMYDRYMAEIDDLKCDRCNEQLEQAGQVCPACSNSINTDNRERKTGMLSFAGFVASALSIILFVTSLILPWGSELANKSLASVPNQLAFNVPSLFILLIATFLILSQATRPAAIVLLVLFSAVGGISLSSSAISIFVLSKDHAGKGFWTSILSLLASLASVGFLAKVTKVRFGIDHQPLTWASVGLTSAALWVVGDWLPWAQTTYHLNEPFKFKLTGTNTTVIKCCIPFQNVPWPSMLRETLVMVFILVAVVASNYLRPTWLGGVGMVALGGLYLSNSFSWFASTIVIPDISVSNISGWTEAEILRQGFTATQQGLLGGWLAFIACILLIFVGTFRIIGALADDSMVTDETV